nr:MAG TPA: hypothetical protein [Caudoviricetes sp.]
MAFIDFLIVLIINVIRINIISPSAIRIIA